jgi:deoxyribose-phosphate aldolase
MWPVELAGLLDASMLRPEANATALERLCQDAVELGFFSVCVNSGRVAAVARRLQGTAVKVCSVVGFPLGAATSRSKAFEAREAISDGASEIDMVINVGLLRSGDFRGVEEDIKAVRRATRSVSVLKTIIETVFLTQEEKIIACELSRKAGADFVATSTGFLGGGATVEDILLVRRIVGKDLGIKASGGVRTYKNAVAMVAAGASRIGAQGCPAIVAGAEMPRG